ncbi:MAG: hypothetical protein FJ276_06825 [Planctomycetes bacterium]|nr:hypothetical protein [Planctomycetota bacterium]
MRPSRSVAITTEPGADTLVGSSPSRSQSGDKSPNSKGQYRWIHSNHSYKSGGALETHFGLGKQTAAHLKITLPDGETASFAGVKTDQFLDLNLASSQSTPVRAETKP